MTAALAFLFTVFTIKIIITGRTCIHYKKTNKQTCQKQLRPTESPARRTAKPLDFTIIPPFNRLGNTFPKKLMRITWIISRLCVQRRSCRSGFCFARGRLPALLSVSSGSCGLWCFLPVVIESDQFSLMTRTQIVMLWLSCYGFLIKDVTTVTCYNHYKLLCLQKHNVKLQSFCWGESLSECGRNFCHIVSSLWWSVSVGNNRKEAKQIEWYSGRTLLQTGAFNKHAIDLPCKTTDLLFKTCSYYRRNATAEMHHIRIYLKNHLRCRQTAQIIIKQNTSTLPANTKCVTYI